MSDASHTDAIVKLLGEVAEELAAARHKHGLQHHRPHLGGYQQRVAWERIGITVENQARYYLEETRQASWAAILAEEFGEALRADSFENLRAELLQVAAMAVAWIDRLDRGPA